MAIVTNGKYYRFKSFIDSKYLNIYTDGALANKKNVCTYDLVSNDLAQVWKVENHSGFGCTHSMMKSAKNTSFALDHWRGTDNHDNADIYTIGTQLIDLKDQWVEFESVNNNWYRIKLKYQDGEGNYLYLTVDTSTTPHNVKWTVFTGYSNQWWFREEISNCLTYPCQTMRITQRHDGSTSHIGGATGTPHDYAIDEGCDDSGRSYMYCPCDEMEIIRLYGVGNSGTNTIWLRSTSPVLTPIGIDYIVMMVTHPLDDDLSALYVGQTFSRGEPMFREGNDGNATGYHFHISMGLGNITGNGWAQNSNGVWVLTTTGNTIKVNEAFYVDSSFTTILNANGYTFMPV